MIGFIIILLLLVEATLLGVAEEIALARRRKEYNPFGEYQALQRLRVVRMVMHAANTVVLLLMLTLFVRGGISPILHFALAFLGSIVLTRRVVLLSFRYHEDMLNQLEMHISMPTPQ